MAGIGFELKRMFDKKGVLNQLKAYSYASAVCIGPMILGVFLQLIVYLLAVYFKASKLEQELLLAMLNYALIASLAVTSIFSMVTTRYIADKMYEGNYQKVLPCFLGSVFFMFVIGILTYGTFLLFSGVSRVYQGLSLFAVL